MSFIMSFDRKAWSHDLLIVRRNVIWSSHVAVSLDLSCCHVARLMLLCRSTCHVAVSLDLSCCRVARLVMLPCRSTYVAVSLELSCCRVARLMLPCRSTCHVAMLTCLVSWLSWSCAAVLNVSCYRLSGLSCLRSCLTSSTHWTCNTVPNLCY